MSANRSEVEWGHVARLQTALAALAQFGLQTTDELTVLTRVMEVTGETLGVGNVSLFEVCDGGDELVGRAALHAGHVVPTEIVEQVRVPSGRGSFPGYAVAQGAVVVTDRLVDDPRFTSRAPDFDVPLRAGAAAPIGWDKHPWGVLVAFHRNNETFTDDEVQFVQAVAATTGLVIQRNRIEADLRASSTRLDLSLAAGGLGAWSWDVGSGRLILNGSALTIHGMTPGAFNETLEVFLALVHPDDRGELRQVVDRSLQTDGEYRHKYRIVRRADGEVRWVEVWGRLVESGTTREFVGVVEDITHRHRAEEQREAMLERERVARVQAEVSQERLGFLAASSVRLGSSLDPDVAAAEVAELSVPAIADIAFIDVIDDDAALVERSAKGTDLVQVVAVRELRRQRTKLGTGGLWNEADVAASGDALLRATITDHDFQNAAIDAEHLALYRTANVHSAVVAPLRARGRIIGVLTLMRTNDDGAPYDRNDLALVEELAARAALAIDNARLFHSRNRVARSLQAALLPPALPRIAGLDLAARYQVAEADVAIGGDFYDVIEVAPGQWGVVVGDVCGRGPDAAALTGLVRHSVRAATVRETLPSLVLAQTNAAVIDQIDDAKFCTAAYVHLAPAGDGAVAALASSAGHPRPVVVRSSGRAEFIECAGTLLGVVPDPYLVDVEAELAPGDAVVLYTDGVTEARRGGEQFGEDRLLDVLTGLAGGMADEIAAGLADAVEAFRQSASDDTAILVARAVPSAP